jgi:His/Glu/Gln/Arg/opine family amino acid ABC transporter permease subunit
MGYQLNFAPVWRDFDLLLSGLGLGLVLAVIAILVGCLIGLVAAFAMVSKHITVRRIATVYVTAIRNQPPLFLIIFTFFVLPQFGIRIGKVEAFVLPLAIYAGALLTEVFRGALLSLPRGLREAGLAIGLTERQTRVWVIIPVMFRNALPALSNNFVSIFKDTSLAAAIAVPDLTFYAKQINSNTFRVVETWSVCSLMYVTACYVIAAGLRVAERRLAIPH